MTDAWRRALVRRDADPDGAITAARSMLESVLKTVLDDRNQPYDEGTDLPKLFKLVQKELDLAPASQTEDQFRAILGACSTVVQGLGSSRNKVGDAHGQGRSGYRAAPRHAALAVNLAGAMAMFLVKTAEARA
ncbi:MAG: abortive infection family protein, partial [Solirubrobacteraceae bacterium]